MAAKRNNPANTVKPNREIKMVRFVGMDWVVTNSYKRNGSRFYDLVAAAHTEIPGQRMRRVPTGTIRKYPDGGTRTDGSLVTFKEMQAHYGV